MTIFQELRLERSEQQLDKGQGRLTQAILAKQLGISTGLLSMIENGDQPPNYEVLKRYHKMFGTPYEVLMGEVKSSTKKEHMMVSKELGLSSSAIDGIKNLSPESLNLLNAMLSDDTEKESFLNEWFRCSDIIYMNTNHNDINFPSKNANIENDLSNLIINYTKEKILKKLKDMFSSRAKERIESTHSGLLKQEGDMIRKDPFLPIDSPYSNKNLNEEFNTTFINTSNKLTRGIIKNKKQ